MRRIVLFVPSPSSVYKMHYFPPLSRNPRTDEQSMDERHTLSDMALLCSVQCPENHPHANANNILTCILDLTSIPSFVRKGVSFLSEVMDDFQLLIFNLIEIRFHHFCRPPCHKSKISFSFSILF